MKTITKTEENIKRTRRPTHPGTLLRDGILKDLEPRLTQQEVAELLGVSRQTIAQLLNEQRAVSPEMAHRLARAFGGSADAWMRHQISYDLWEVEHDERKWSKIEKIERLQAA